MPASNIYVCVFSVIESVSDLSTTHLETKPWTVDSSLPAGRDMGHCGRGVARTSQWWVPIFEALALRIAVLNLSSYSLLARELLAIVIHQVLCQIVNLTNSRKITNQIKYYNKSVSLLIRSGLFIFRWLYLSDLIVWSIDWIWYVVYKFLGMQLYWI